MLFKPLSNNGLPSSEVSGFVLIIVGPNQPIKKGPHRLTTAPDKVVPDAFPYIVRLGSGPLPETFPSFVKTTAIMLF